MTPTIKTYVRISENRISVYQKKVSLAFLKNTFIRYAKTYRLAYGKLPSVDSIKTELTQYNGVSIDQLIEWLKDVTV